MGNLKQTELKRLKTEERKAEDTKRNKNHKKQCLATLKRLKRGDDNELERSLRLEKVVANKQHRLVLETEEERRARLENVQLPNGSGWPWRRRKKNKTGEIKGVVNVGMVLSLKLILKSWQLCFLFKLDVLTT